MNGPRATGGEYTGKHRRDNGPGAKPPAWPVRPESHPRPESYARPDRYARPEPYGRPDAGQWPDAR
jgi:hypothetical protein